VLFSTEAEHTKDDCIEWLKKEAESQTYWADHYFKYWHNLREIVLNEAIPELEDRGQSEHTIKNLKKWSSD
jgi:hypothetical protein